MKFLFILVSEERDIYYEQTLVSVVSLRRRNPDAFISLVVDDRTDLSLKGFRSSIKDYVQEYKVFPFEDDVSNMVRSRLLKTNMRNLIEGDFLFLDGDTAVVSELDEAFDDSVDIGAVADLHSRENDKYRMKHKKFNLNIKKTGFGLSLADLYFNSGVIFARDNERARAFCDKWHELYKQCAEKGIFTDQLSFNECNRVLGKPMKEIAGEWNCQVREAYNHLTRVKTIYPILCKAKIVHFFGSGIDGKKEPHPLMKKDFFKQVKLDQTLTPTVLDIIDHARTRFVGAPEILDAEVKFPLFFIYRQFPRFFKVLMFFKGLLGNA